MCHLCSGKPFLHPALCFLHPDAFAESGPNDPGARPMPFVRVARCRRAAAQTDALAPVSRHQAPTWTSICPSPPLAQVLPVENLRRPELMHVHWRVPPHRRQPRLCVNVRAHAATLFIQSVPESEGNFFRFLQPGCSDGACARSLIPSSASLLLLSHVSL